MTDRIPGLLGVLIERRGVPVVGEVPGYWPLNGRAVPCGIDGCTADVSVDIEWAYARDMARIVHQHDGVSRTYEVGHDYLRSGQYTARMTVREHGRQFGMTMVDAHMPGRVQFWLAQVHGTAAAGLREWGE